MTDRRPSLPLLVGLVVSLILHGVLILPLMIRALTTPPSSSATTARFDSDAVEPPEEDELDELDLGIDAQTPSSLTWIGYEEYEKHMAQLAEMDQASFTEQPSLPGGRPVPEMDTTVAEAQSSTDAEQMSEPTEASEVVDVAVNDSAAPDPMDSAEPVDPTLEIADATPDPVPPGERVERTPPAVIVAFDQPVLTPIGILMERFLLNAQAARPESDVEPATPVQPEAPAPAASAPPATAAATPGVSGDSGEPSPTKPDPGERAPKESDPFARIEVQFDEIKLGKPIARPGLELRPRRPVFTNLQEVTAGGCNPLVRIRFGPDGIPVHPALVLESKCDSRIAAAIESSLYRWRATGEEIRALKEGETLMVELRIVIH